MRLAAKGIQRRQRRPPFRGPAGVDGVLAASGRDLGDDRVRVAVFAAARAACAMLQAHKVRLHVVVIWRVARARHGIAEQHSLERDHVFAVRIERHADFEMSRHQWPPFALRRAGNTRSGSRGSIASRATAQERTSATAAVRGRSGVGAGGGAVGRCVGAGCRASPAPLLPRRPLQGRGKGAHKGQGSMWLGTALEETSP